MGDAVADIAHILVENLEAFTAFARSQLGDHELARDAVQESLTKAVQAESQPPLEDTIQWFYRILRRTIVDLHRRRDARERMMERYMASPDSTEEERGLLCECYEKLLPELPVQYGDLIRRIELGGETIAAVATERAVTPNAMTVQLHRARRRLRELMEATCQVCAKHGCLDCHCSDSPKNSDSLQSTD